ncbi:MAG: DUF2062 domain-containing protein [Deltaproteobacteria bacterium]|nr:DUF2062 domain-containing protein [Deltaproteobacteria bacterium]
MTPERPKTLVVLWATHPVHDLRSVVEGYLADGRRVLVVDDGTTDGNFEVLSGLPVAHHRLRAPRGRRDAILAGAALARELGCEALLTTEADNGHDPAIGRLLLEAARGSWPAVVIGTRPPETAGVARLPPGRRAPSRFWIRIECGQDVPDSGSGLRLYPVEFLLTRRFVARGEGFEVEALVRGAWAGLPLLGVPLAASVRSGSRPASAVPGLTERLSLGCLHLLLIARTLLPWPHSRMVGRTRGVGPRPEGLHPLRFIRRLCREHATAAELGAAAWVGIFIGALPIIPFGIVTIAYVNHKLHLNKLAGIAASNLCVFPFVPFACVEVGHLLRYGRLWSEFNRQTVLHEIHYRLWEWLLGSLVVGPLLGAGGGLLTYALVRSMRRSAAVPEGNGGP